MKEIRCIDESDVQWFGQCYKCVFSQLDDSEIPAKMRHSIVNAIDVRIGRGFMVTIHHIDNRLVPDKKIELSKPLVDKLNIYFQMEEL
jgi:hypothetical protein